MQQEGKINMEVIQTLANEKMLANYIDHKCAGISNNSLCVALTRLL